MVGNVLRNESQSRWSELSCRSKFIAVTQYSLTDLGVKLKHFRRFLSCTETDIVSICPPTLTRSARGLIWKKYLAARPDPSYASAVKRDPLLKWARVCNMGGHGLESDSVQWQRRALSFIIVRSRTYGTSGIGNRPAPVEGKKDGGGREWLCTQTCYDCCASILIMCAICGIRLSENQNVSAVES